MLVRILGSAAGGGLPQWNCRCANCEAARAGSPHVRPRTQSSVAISADGRSWFLLNVSPDIRQQIFAFPALGAPAGTLRGQAIAGCILTDAELDHTAGLLLLREGESFPIYCTPLVRRWLNRYLPIEPLLAAFNKPDWRELPLNEIVMLADSELALQAFEVEAHLPRFVDERSTTVGSVIGLLLQNVRTGGKMLYAPCIGSLREPLLSLAKQADVIMIDGTFLSNDEPLRFGRRSALEMGHVPISGPHGSLAWLADLPARDRVYIHINNTNPMLHECSPDYHLVRDKGVCVGRDGDAFEL